MILDAALAPMLVRRESRSRSLLKTLTWRVTATADTFAISWVVTGNLVFAGSIASVEVATKMVLYYVHERGWSHVPWGWVTETLHAGKAGHGGKAGQAGTPADKGGADAAAAASQASAASQAPAAPASPAPASPAPASSVPAAAPETLQDGRTARMHRPVGSDPADCATFRARPADGAAYDTAGYKAEGAGRRAAGRS